MCSFVLYSTHSGQLLELTKMKRERAMCLTKPSNHLWISSVEKTKLMYVWSIVINVSYQCKAVMVDGRMGEYTPEYTLSKSMTRWLRHYVMLGAWHQCYVTKYYRLDLLSIHTEYGYNCNYCMSWSIGFPVCIQTEAHVIKYNTSEMIRRLFITSANCAMMTSHSLTKSRTMWDIILTCCKSPKDHVISLHLK